MTTDRLPRTVMSGALVLAPLTGLVAAAAQPALRATRAEEIAAISAHPDRFYVYALAMTVSSYLLVPAMFGVLTLLREHAPRWASVAVGVTQVGLLIAIGDAATEFLYWQMGVGGADRAQMVALAERYENAAGVSVLYSVGGLATLVGIALTSVVLWRSRVAPRWAAVALLVGTAAQIAGFSGAGQPLLIGSYMVLLAAFAPVAIALARRTPSPSGTTPAVRNTAAAAR